MNRSLRAGVGAAALLAALGLAFGAHTVSAQKTITLPDVPSGDGTASVLPNGWQVTPAGQAIALPGDLPLKMAVTPDGKSLIVNTGGWHDHSVCILDLATDTLAQKLPVGKDWAGLALDSEGDDLYVSGGGTPTASFRELAPKFGATPEMLEATQQPILRFSLQNGQLAPKASLDIPGLTGDDRWIGGLAADSAGALYAVNVNTDTVYKMGGTPKTVQASAKVGYRPLAIVLSPDGKQLAVSNWGDESVSLLDAGTLKETSRVKVGNHPNEMVWGKDGRLFVADAGSNAVSVLQGGKVTETVKTSLSPKDPVGSTPDALALAPDGKTLYVANADNNDVAVIDTSDPKESKVAGFIPTGWYPSALAVSPDGKKLYVGTGKGLRFRGNVPATTPFARLDAASPHRYDYIGAVLSGAVNVVPVPDPAQLARYTQQVKANVPASPVARADADDIQKNVFKKIKHVVYIIRENRTYDQVLGDLGQGNGDPNLTLYGAAVTPNAHQIAHTWVTLDNLYCNGEVSEDGHQWCNAAYATDFTEKAWPNSYSERGEPDGDSRLTASPAGYLWDSCAKHGVSYYSYEEMAGFRSTPNAAPVFTGDKTLNGHASADFVKVPSNTGGRDPGRADVFVRDLHQGEQTGRWPQFIVMHLGEDHTQGTNPGAFTPEAHVASNDQALGKVVEAVSHSKFWQETAIFVIEDDAQNGPDHVDAHRTVGFVISPYVRRGAVDSTFYTTAGMVRTMELILGLPPMTQFDRAATPFYNAFQAQPVMTAYDNLPAKIDLQAKNTAQSPGAQASAKLDFSDVDRADPDALNAILWNERKPGIPLPAPVRSARLVR